MEETGLIVEAGRWALRRAIADRRRWTEAGLQAPRIAINVSTVELRKQDFVDVFAHSLGLGDEDHGIDIEVTESIIMEDVAANIAKLLAIRELGVDIAIDDFGTGYSSLAYLARLPVQMLKIDRTFVSAMLEDASAMTLVSTMISLGALTQAHRSRRRRGAGRAGAHAAAPALRPDAGLSIRQAPHVR